MPRVKKVARPRAPLLVWKRPRSRWINMQCIHHTHRWPASFRSGISFEWPLDILISLQLMFPIPTWIWGEEGRALMQETSKRVEEIKAANETSPLCLAIRGGRKKKVTAISEILLPDLASVFSSKCECSLRRENLFGQVIW